MSKTLGQPCACASSNDGNSPSLSSPMTVDPKLDAHVYPIVSSSPTELSPAWIPIPPLDDCEPAGDICRTPPGPCSNIRNGGLNVRDFGARGDGIHDDGPCIQKAIDFARGSGEVRIGNTVYFPPGKYRIDASRRTILATTVGLVGPDVVDGLPPSEYGAIFVIDSPPGGAPVFTIGRQVQFRNLAFFYPRQTDSPDPLRYAPTIKFDLTDTIQFVYIDRCAFLNSYIAIEIGNRDDYQAGWADQSAGHVWITNCGIYGINTGIVIGRNLEYMHILNNHFTFGLADGIATEEGLRLYTRLHGTAMRYYAGDGLDIRGNMIFGYLVGIHVAGGITESIVTEECKDKMRSCEKRYVPALFCSISSNKFDQVSQGILVTGSGLLSVTTITDNSFVSFVENKNTKENRRGFLYDRPSFGIYINGGKETLDRGSAKFLFQMKLTVVGNQFGPTSAAHIAIDVPETFPGSVVISGNIFQTITGNVYQGEGLVPSSLSLNCAQFDIVYCGNHVDGEVDPNSGRVAIGIKSYAARSINANGNTFRQLSRAYSVIDDNYDEYRIESSTNIGLT